MDDGYMGSGKIIRRAIEKYGIENFTKTIIEEFSSSEEMYQRERDIVNAEFLTRKDIYNIKLGGTGGFDYINTRRPNGFNNVSVARAGRLLTDSILERKHGPNWRSVIAIVASKFAHSKEAAKKRYDTQLQNGTYTTDHMQTLSAKKNRKLAMAKMDTKQGRKTPSLGGGGQPTETR